MFGKETLVNLLTGHDPASDPPFVFYRSNGAFIRGERERPTFPPIDAQIGRNTPIVVFCLILAVAFGTFLYPSIITFFGTGVTSGQITSHITVESGTRDEIPLYFTLYHYTVDGVTYTLREPADPAVAAQLYNGGSTVRVRYIVQLPGIATMVDPTNTYPANEKPIVILGALALFALFIIFAILLLHRQNQARRLQARRRAAWHTASVITGELISCTGHGTGSGRVTAFMVTARYRYTSPDTGEIVESVENNLSRPDLRHRMPLPGTPVKVVYYPTPIRFRGRALHEFLL